MSKEYGIIDNLTIDDIIFLIKVLDSNICAMMVDYDERYEKGISKLRKLKLAFSNMLMETLISKNKSQGDYKEEA